MSEPTLACPKCGNEIKLTESLAAPLLDATRKECEQRLQQKDEAVAAHEKLIREREEAVKRAGETVDQRVAEQMRAERTRIATEEAKKARLTLAADLEQKSKENAELQEVLKQRDVKLAEAQKAQSELMKKERALADAMREMDLNIQKQVQQELAAVREKARTEATESLTLKLKEKDETITAMQRKLEEAQRKAEQGSQQLQGEVQELQFEELLSSRFPHDGIEAVPKGEHGGDILQRVRSASAVLAGTVLWESKRTKNWSDTWLPKLRDDQRVAKAELAVIVSAVLPKGIETFDHVDGIWITHPRCILPVALVLRQTLLEVAAARQSAQGQQTKAELVYRYLTGPNFKHRVQAIVEAFSSMQEDLDKERKAIMKQWAKRETEIERVLEATVGLYGDLQGIAGKSLQEIEGLDMKAIGEGAPS